MSTPPGPQDPYGTQPPAGGYGAPPPPSYSGGTGAGGTPPPNYLVWAIISVFLCWPLAIPAIIFSTQVNSKWQQGDAAGAADSSRKAKQFALWATIAGVIAIILWFVLGGAALLASSNSSY
jgi:hypothetical protein